MARTVRVQCVHGVGHPESDHRWEQLWQETVSRGLHHWSQGVQAEFRFTAYDDLFDRAALNLATVLEAIARLSASGVVYGIGDLFRPRGLGALSEQVRWTAGMVAQWAADEELRRKTRQAVQRDLAEFDPQVVLAHSLGSLITYDLLAQEPGLVAGRTLITFGSQIGNPFVRSIFGGRIVALREARRWFHLFNAEDDVFTTRLSVPASNFEQVDTFFDIAGMADHDAAQYLAHANTVTRVWRELAQTASRALARAQRVVVRTEHRPRRRALLVGINDYPEPENRLEGCVNDVFEMSAVLQDLKFDPEDIRVVLNERATTEGIQERLHWLLDGADDDAIRVFFYSGHGAQMPGYGERGEVDHINECLVPYDFDWTLEHAILDDWFLDLYSQLPYKTNFVGIFDCCHSGGMTRSGLPKARGLNPPDDIRHRALRWNGEMWVPRDLNLAKQKLLQSKADQRLYLGERGDTKRLGRAVSLWTEERHFRRAKKAYGHAGPYVPVLLQACREEQLSYEYRHGVTAYGAFTYCLSSLFRSLKAAGKSVTFETLTRQVAMRLKTLGYPQTPVLFGPRRKTTQPIPYLHSTR